jgi:hypothetical protein
MIAFPRFLLKLYPPLHRENFADEMLAVFTQGQADVRSEGIPARAAFYLRETLGLAGGALRERLRSIDRYPCRREQVRMGGIMILQTRCRFPRSATAMMTFVLVIVVGMIAKIQGVSHFYGKVISGELPRQPWHWPSYYGLISGIVVCFLAAWTVGAAVWAVAYAMRRTAAQHLGNFETWPPTRS